MSQHYTIGSLLNSLVAEHRAIDNNPPSDVRKQLVFTLAGLERITAALGFQVIITSGYRSEALNEAVGGSKNSQHCKGEAVDFICPLYGTPYQVAIFLEHFVKIIGIDQLINEGKWVHASFTNEPRHQVLTKVGDMYVVGIV